MAALTVLIMLVLLTLVIFTLVWVATLSSAVRRLERELPRLRQGAIPQPATPAQAPPPAAPASPPPAPAPAPMRTHAPRTEPRPPSRTAREWEALIGERLLNRIGALALIIGVGLFTKYAFDRDWISPPVRVLLGAALGLALVVYASRLRERYPVFVQGVLGAGISILYLAAYASFNFYDLVPQGIAIASMSVVTVLAFERAVRFDSLAVGLIGWAGGFLTPALLSGGETGAGGLFFYLLLLNAALLGLVVVRKKWWVLQPLSLGATYLTYLVWHVSSFTRGDLAAAFAFVTAIWLGYLVVDVRAVSRGTDRPVLDRLVAGANGTFYYAALVALINPHFPGLMGPATFAVAAAYLVPVLILGRSHAAFTTKAVVLVVIGTGIEASGLALAAFWSLQALALLLIGVTFGIRHLRVSALVLYPIAFFTLMGSPGALMSEDLENFVVLANPRFFAFLAAAIAAGAGAILYRRVEGTERAWAQPALHYLWTLVGFILVTVETSDLFLSELPIASTPLSLIRETVLFNRTMAFAAVWTIYAVLLVSYGRLAETPPATYAGLITLVPALLVASTRGLVFSPVRNFVPILNVRVFVLLAVIAGAWAVSLLITRAREERWRRWVAWLLMASVALLAFVLVTGETRDLFEKRIEEFGGAAPRAPFGGTPFDEGGAPPLEQVQILENQKQLALSGAWLAYSALSMAIGILRRLRGFRIAAMVLFGVTILKVFLYDLSFLDSLYRTISFMALGVILLGVSLAYQRFRTVLFGTD